MVSGFSGLRLAPDKPGLRCGGCQHDPPDDVVDEGVAAGHCPKLRPQLEIYIAIGILCHNCCWSRSEQLSGNFKMSTRNVVLTEHHEAVIDRLVKSGRYQNASEVMREGLRLIEQREAHEAVRLEALREAARIGFSDLDEGRFVDVPADRLESFIAGLGRDAEMRTRKAGI